MITLKKYSQLFVAFFKASFLADLEYRANFITRVLTDIFWYAAQIVTFETLFRYTEKIGDWNLHQMRVFLGVLFVVDALYMIIFSENLDRMSDKVRKGEMDLLLAKPVSSQFMLSCQRMATAIIGNLFLGIAWLGFSLWNLPGFNVLSLLWLLLLIPVGLLTLYSVRFIVSAMAVIFTRSENLQYLWYQLYRLGMRPDSIYFPWLKYLLLTLFPVAFIASVPASALLDPPNFGLFAWALLWSVCWLYGSSRFWKYALTHYSSASS